MTHRMWTYPVSRFPYDELKVDSPCRGKCVTSVSDITTHLEDGRQRSFLLLYLLPCRGKWGSWLSGLASTVCPAFVCWSQLTLKLNAPSTGPTRTHLYYWYHRRHTQALAWRLCVKQQPIGASHVPTAVKEVLHEVEVCLKIFPFLRRQKLHLGNIYSAASARSTWRFNHNVASELTTPRFTLNQPCVLQLAEFCTCLATRPIKEKKTPSARLIFNASLSGEIKLFFSAHSVFFFHKPHYGGQISGDVFPCLSAEPFGHWAALWHTTWKGFSNEANIIAHRCLLSQNMQISIIVSQSPVSKLTDKCHCVERNDLCDT